jgi:hypothetical protein
MPLSEFGLLVYGLCNSPSKTPRLCPHTTRVSLLISIQAALKSQQKAMLFSQYLPKLNNLLPAFGAELSAFPDVEKVQRPLQRIFAIYIECYTVMRNQILQQTARGSPSHPSRRTHD